MHILITSANNWFARAVIAALAPEMRIRALDTSFAEPLPDGVDACAGDMRNPAVVAAALDGVDTVVHLTPISMVAGAVMQPWQEQETGRRADSSHFAVGTDGEAADALDAAARGTYVLMNAAKAANVDRVVLGSTLALFERLPADWRVTERGKGHGSLRTQISGNPLEHSLWRLRRRRDIRPA